MRFRGDGPQQGPAMDFRIGADHYKQTAGVRAEMARQIKESR
jgi:hypothetical protein